MGKRQRRVWKLKASFFLGSEITCETQTLLSMVASVCVCVCVRLLSMHDLGEGAWNHDVCSVNQRQRLHAYCIKRIYPYDNKIVYNRRFKKKERKQLTV